MSLHALVEKWRDEARDHDLHKDPLPASILRECADELAAELAGGGEPLGYISERTAEIIRGLSPKGELTTVITKFERAVPLFTHPAGAVQVTDEIIADVLSHAHNWRYLMCRAFNSAEDSGDERYWEREIAALDRITSALNPGGSRE